MINEIHRMQQLAGIKSLNELHVNNPNFLFKTTDEYEYDDEGYKFLELLDINGKQQGWMGYIKGNDNFATIEFLFEIGETELEYELKNMKNLIEYCNKYKIKYNKLDVDNDDELIHIQIPLKYIKFNNE